MDSAEIQKLVDGWAAKGMVTQDEAQSSQVKAQSNPAAEPYGVSRANDQILEVLTEKGFGTQSRMRRRPAWMDDYV